MSATGIDIIQFERFKQLTSCGYGAAHDDAHVDSELVKAAIVYAAPCDLDTTCAMDLQSLWPWPDEPPTLTDESSSVEERVHELAKAGALIAAEIERLLRSAR